MKSLIILMLFLGFTAQASEDLELDQICKVSAEMYAVAVAGVNFKKPLVGEASLLRNGLSESPSHMSQVWNVNVSSNGAYVTSVVVHTYLDSTCNVTKIIPNALD